MRIRFNPRWLLISALVFFLQIGRSQTLPGTISFDLGAEDAPGTQLWDLSGTYRFDLILVQKNGLETPFGMTFNMVQDAQGRLFGVTNDLQDLEFGDNSTFIINYTINGKVNGSAGIGHAVFTIRVSGSGFLAGQEVDFFTGTITVDATTDPATGQLIGNKPTKVNLTFPGFGVLKGSADFLTALPPGVDGTWNLSLQLAPLSTISGSAIIGTPSKDVGMDVTGNFKNNLFKLQLTGANDVANTVSGFGSSAKVFLTSDLSSLQLNGKLLGQKMGFIFPP
jgi:hypothetical protein